MLEFMEQPVDSLAGEDLAAAVPPEQDDMAPLVRCIVAAADGRKAEQIVALRVSHVSTLTSFLIILSGNSRPQNQAIASAITKDVQAEHELRPGGSGVPEGSPESGWMVLDYGSVMVHIMTPKSRLFYNVEGQWRDKGGESMDLSDILIPNSVVEDANSNNNPTMESLQAQDDPFWS
jgi:ribosome-associated protein